MAQVSKICSNRAQSTNLLPNVYKPQIPKSFSSISLKSQLMGSSNCLSLTLTNGLVGNCAVGKLRVGPLRVSASVATAEKPSTVPEIVLQPIKEISGTITLPGSKSLSNRILLIAAPSEHIELVSPAHPEAEISTFDVVGPVCDQCPRSGM